MPAEFRIETELFKSALLSIIEHGTCIFRHIAGLQLLPSIFYTSNENSIADYYFSYLIAIGFFAMKVSDLNDP